MKVIEPVTRDDAEAPSDADLYAHLRAGDAAALGALYDRHADAAYALACRLVGQAEAEDVVHDAFMVLVRDPSAFVPDRGAFRPWLLRIVHNRCINLLRRNRSAGEDGLAALRDRSLLPADQVIASMEEAAVRNQLQALPSEQRQALALAYYGGLSQSEMAAQLNLPLGTVKARVRRGLLTLRERLGWLAAAALVLALGGGGAAGWLRDNQARSQLNMETAAVALLTSTETTADRLEPVAVGLPADAHGHWFHREGVATQVVVGEFLPPLTSGEQYTVWQQRGGVWTRAGTLDASSRLIIAGSDGAGISTVEITRETGIPREPAGPVLLRFPG